MHVLILGAGFSGSAIAKAFLPLAESVTGTTRSEDKLAGLLALGIDALVYDGTTISPELAAAMKRTTHLIQSIAPGRDGDPMMRPGTPSLAKLMPNLEWAGYLSTVGVYGDHGGAWVAEDASLEPVSARSVERVAAEQAWLAFGQVQNIPVAVLRLSGIYGPGRNAFCNLAAGTARRLIKPNQVFNRIRVEDIAGATVFLSGRSIGGVFNITDHEPAPPQDIVAEAARLMGVAPPPEMPFETAELSPMARSFYGENKRVSNTRLRDLGFVFRFPDYRISLAELWSNGHWRG
jgi:nucleoside-diphosphate-sugar epimerase